MFVGPGPLSKDERRKLKKAGRVWDLRATEKVADPNGGHGGRRTGGSWNTNPLFGESKTVRGVELWGSPVARGFVRIRKFSKKC